MSGSYPAGLKIWKISQSNIGFMTGIFIDMNAHFQLGHFAGLMIRGDPNRSGISIQILQMTAQEEEDAAGGIVDTVRSVKKAKEAAGVGHCTVYYGCCAKARGFDLLTNEDREKASEPDWLALKDEFNGTYLCRLLRAYLIGIESEMDAAPKRT
ncbi:MAG: hypothetical protein JWP44_5240 [Mucilaginibacter sp.]|nr:hypothetical protein [Mucilaginibacter sp.]